MKIVFLGTNGWYDTDTGNAISTLIDCGERYIILDAGNGIYKADRYMKEKKPVVLFLSHFHIDHICGLHILVKFGFESLTIIGQPGTRETLEYFLGDKFSVPLKKLPYPADVVELAPGWHEKPFKLQTLKLKHASSCFGLRMHIDGKVISYCTDTGPCRASLELAKEADILISECAFASGQENPEWPHMNPELAAKLAKDSGAKKLVMTHFDAEVYQRLEQRDEAEGKAKKIFPDSAAARDGMEVSV